MSTMRVLVAEDHQLPARTIARGLRRAAIAVDVAASADEAERMCLLTAYDVLVLDRDLPVMTGDEVCQRLRTLRVPPRILILTASAEVADRAYELDELGADDYMTKPLDFAELVTRVHALYRRTPKPPQTVLRHREIRMDHTHREARVDGQPVELTPRELTVLRRLLASTGTPVTHHNLVRDVWNENLPQHQHHTRHHPKRPPS